MKIVQFLQLKIQDIFYFLSASRAVAIVIIFKTHVKFYTMINIKIMAVTSYKLMINHKTAKLFLLKPIMLKVIAANIRSICYKQHKSKEKL